MPHIDQYLIQTHPTNTADNLGHTLLESPACHSLCALLQHQDGLLPDILRPHRHVVQPSQEIVRQLIHQVGTLGRIVSVQLANTQECLLSQRITGKHTGMAA